LNGARDNVFQQNCWQNLTFISRGSSSGNPGDLFLSRSLDEVLALWRKQFDYVIIDTCPAFAADDAITLAPKVDGTLFVVRSRFARATAVRESLELLYHRRARVLGLIYNRADSSAHSYDYYKYEEYHTRALSA
jgi:Mrp family chromosome partitioning ATPase